MHSTHPMVTNTSSAGIIKNIQKRRNGDQSIEPFHHHSQTNYSCQRRGLSWPHIIWRPLIAAPFSFIFNLFHRDPVFWPDRCAAPRQQVCCSFFIPCFFFLDVKQIQQPKTGIVYNAQSELLFVLFCFFLVSFLRLVLMEKNSFVLS